MGSALAGRLDVVLLIPLVWNTAHCSMSLLYFQMRVTVANLLHHEGAPMCCAGEWQAFSYDRE